MLRTFLRENGKIFNAAAQCIPKQQSCSSSSTSTSTSTSCIKSFPIGGIGQNRKLTTNNAMLRHNCGATLLRVSSFAGMTALLRHQQIRCYTPSSPEELKRLKANAQRLSRSILMGCAAGLIVMLTASYATVPLFRMFCQMEMNCPDASKMQQGGGGLGLGAKPKDMSRVQTMKRKKRLIRVVFGADKDSRLKWEFAPQQHEVWVHPGETALIFYTATNPTTKPIVGISSYNIMPFEAGFYFCKIQCFCFEEQILQPGEQVDLPVFFYIDPDYASDIRLESEDTVTLTYTFFQSHDGIGNMINLQKEYERQAEIARRKGTVVNHPIQPSKSVEIQPSKSVAVA